MMQGPLACFRRNPQPPADDRRCSTWNIPATHPAIHRRGRKRERAVGGHRPRATEPARTATPTNPRQAAPKNWVFHVEHPSPSVTQGRGPSGAPSPAPPNLPGPPPPPGRPKKLGVPRGTSQPATGERQARPASPDPPPPPHTTTATSRPVRRFAAGEQPLRLGHRTPLDAYTPAWRNP